MSLAATRARRANAGANMSKLLDKEEAMKAEDDFYKTQYGGFDEVENDSDFDDSGSSDSENVIDSDFDIDETAAMVDDDEEANEKALQVEERESRRKRGANVYKDPKARGTKPKAVVKKAPTSPSKPSTSTTPGRGRPARKRQALMPEVNDAPSVKRHRPNYEQLDDDDEDDSLGGDGGNHSISKNLRRSTQKSSKEIRVILDERRREQERMKKRKQNRGRNHEYRELTQEEMLREAKKTEVENIKSLKQYKNLEIEKVKKIKPRQAQPEVPMIRYHSYTEYDADVDEDVENVEGGKRKKHARTIVTFPSYESFVSHFPGYKPDLISNSHDSFFVNDNIESTQSPAASTDSNDDQSKLISSSITVPKPGEGRKRGICPITGKPANYFDPLTKTPYYDKKAFCIIRNRYANYLETLDHLKDDPRVKKFVDHSKEYSKEDSIVDSKEGIKVVTVKLDSKPVPTPLRVQAKPKLDVNIQASIKKGNQFKQNVILSCRTIGHVPVLPNGRVLSYTPNTAAFVPASSNPIGETTSVRTISSFTSSSQFQRLSAGQVIILRSSAPASSSTSASTILRAPGSFIIHNPANRQILPAPQHQPQPTYLPK